MLTDWVLIRRLGFEIERRLRGAKVQDVGLLPDRRLAIALWNRGETQLLCIELFGTPPAITLEAGELPIAPEPGFVRALGAAIRGTVLLGCKARKGDRLLRLTFGARSRFGVGDELVLYLELVPRFGNAILVKGDTIVAAAKEFSLAENGTRAIAVGQPYQMPPLGGGQAIPKLVAQGLPSASPAELETLFESEEAMTEPLWVYRRDGVLVQAHVLALPQFTDDAITREPALLAILREAREARAGNETSKRTQSRRAAMHKRLSDRKKRLQAELLSIASKTARANDRELLRTEGEAIYATLHEQDGAQAEESKERAIDLFAQYKKLGSALPHLASRQTLVASQLETIEALQWEVDRAADEDLADVEEAIAALEPHRVRASHVTLKKRKRAPLEVHAPDGSRILVGRNPTENADLTFRVAKPSDLWFHAQGIPSAHVILQRDDRTEPSDADIECAATLAAYHSRGRASGKIAVDYTQRKFVRKQKDAPPGLVWYTDFQTIVVSPEP